MRKAPPVEIDCAGIEIRDSVVHGTGVFSTENLPRGWVIGRYAGRRYRPQQVAKRQWDTALTYIFGLSDGSVINGAEGGNATRFLNHSCAPNCIAHELTIEGGLAQIEITTLRRISKGRELFLDYRLDAESHCASDYPCRCGASKCRGTLLAISSASRRQRAG